MSVVVVVDGQNARPVLFGSLDCVVVVDRCQSKAELAHFEVKDDANKDVLAYGFGSPHHNGVCHQRASIQFASEASRLRDPSAYRREDEEEDALSPSSYLISAHRIDPLSLSLSLFG